MEEKILEIHHDREDNRYISFVTKRGPNDWGVYVLYEHILYDITDQFEEGFNSKPNIVFLFSVNEHTEFIL